MSLLLEGPVHVWPLGEPRKYAVVTLPFKEVFAYSEANEYNALTNVGEQRAVHEGWVRTLRSEITSGNYTPTSISLGVPHKLQSEVVIKDGQFRLELKEESLLARTDGNHRLNALSELLGTAREELSGLKDKDKSRRKELEHFIQLVETAPITAMVYLDGNLKTDFKNLQAGRPIDKAHLLSLKIYTELAKSDPAYKVAFGIAKNLNTHKDSPFLNLIRFDSRSSGMSLSTVLARGAGDLSTSLLGLARVGALDELNAAVLSAILIQIFLEIKEKAFHLIEGKKVLTPLSMGGSKGGSTIMIGLAICGAYKLVVTGQKVLSPEELAEIVTAAKKTLDVPVAGGFSTSQKRQLIGAFAFEYFKGLKKEKGEEFHLGLPARLLETLSTSSFAVEPFPKSRKKTAEVEPETE